MQRLIPPSFGVRALCAAFLGALICTPAQLLPVARLSVIFPPGAQIGVATEVKVDGADLDDARELRFSNPGISAALKSEGRFTVTATTNVPAGTYEVRVIGRFGASTPRAFVIGDRPELTDAGSNNSIASAQEIPVGSVVNGKTSANNADFFKVKAQKGQRLLFECLGKRIDSKLDPTLILSDAAGKELERARVGGLLDFTAPADAGFILQVHDIQFRGGEDYWYRLAVRKGPWIDFALPAALEAGAKSKVTLFGRNLPEGKPSEFKVDGKTLDQLEVEIDAPKESSPSYLARRPASAAVDTFEYRLPSAEGASNPVLFSLATAKPILEPANATNAAVVTVPCEIQGQFFPRRDVDWYQFEAAKGDVFTIEIFSQRLGLNTDPFALVQRVTKNDKGEEQVSDVQEMYDNDQNVGGNEFNTATRDPVWRLEAKDAGTYRIQARDLFGQTISDPRRIYRLSIRKESPDFRLIAYVPAPPPLNKDSKEVGASGTFLRRGDSLALRILALRHESFDGEIDITAEGLPTGVSAAPLKMGPGVNSSFLILSSTEDAAAWTGPIHIVGKSKDSARRARAGAILWNVADYSNEAITSQLTDELLLTVSGAEVAPLAIRAASEKPVEAAAGSKVNLPLSIVRRSEFNGALKFRTMIDPLKEFDADGKATNATVEIDLGKAKLSPGFQTIPIAATSPGRYRRVTPDEAKAIEAEIKKLKDGLAAITEAPKKEEANNRIKALEGKLAYKDLTATVYASVPVLVLPAAQKTP